MIGAPSTRVSRVGSVTRNALAELGGDRRFIVVSAAVPVVVIYLLSVFWDALNTPMVDQSRFAVAGGAFIVHFVTYVLTAIVLVRERVAGTMERMFISGYRPGEIVTGYLGAYSTLATLQSVVILGVLNLLFELDLGVLGLTEVFLVMWFLSVVSLAMGMFVSNFARNEGQVFPFVPLVMVPPVFLSGMVVAVEALPGWAQVASRVVPLRYAVDAIHEVTDGGTLLDAWGAFLMLPALAIAILFLATTTLREEV